MEISNLIISLLSFTVSGYAVFISQYEKHKKLKLALEKIHMYSWEKNNDDILGALMKEKKMTSTHVHRFLFQDCNLTIKDVYKQLKKLEKRGEFRIYKNHPEYQHVVWYSTKYDDPYNKIRIDGKGVTSEGIHR